MNILCPKIGFIYITGVRHFVAPLIGSIGSDRNVTEFRQTLA